MSKEDGVIVQINSATLLSERTFDVGGIVSSLMVGKNNKYLYVSTW